MGVVWIIATSGWGLTVKFDIRKMRSSRFGLGGRRLHFGQILPTSFSKLLEDPTVIKVGSGILGDIIEDFNPADVVVAPILELQRQKARFMEMTSRWPLVSTIFVSRSLDFLTSR